MLIAGNWKSNKTIAEAREWLTEFRTQNLELNNTTIVICAPFTVLSVMNKSPFALGAQNVSMFNEGAYTGEVTARMIKEVADWVIIGHSERRKYFNETDEILVAKTKKAQEADVKVIYCVPDDTAIVPIGVEVVAYEPVWAIGTGKTDLPENANAVITSIKQKTGVKTVLYGGSVTPENAASFVREPAIDGVLVGAASLDPEKFLQIIYETQIHT